MRSFNSSNSSFNFSVINFEVFIFTSLESLTWSLCRLCLEITGYTYENLIEGDQKAAKRTTKTTTRRKSARKKSPQKKPEASTKTNSPKQVESKVVSDNNSQSTKSKNTKADAADKKTEKTSSSAEAPTSKSEKSKASGSSKGGSDKSDATPQKKVVSKKQPKSADKSKQKEDGGKDKEEKEALVKKVKVYDSFFVLFIFDHFHSRQYLGTGRSGRP